VRRGSAPSVESVGGLHPNRNARLRAALNRLGHPTNKRELFQKHGCVVEWQNIGLEIQVAYYGDGNACDPDTGLAQTATIKGGRARPRWRTWRGLQLGSSERRIAALHPGATWHGHSWWLVEGRGFIGSGCSSGCAYPVLAASVSRGRVQALRVSIGAAGD
jgi:hypothetical protein